jgi:hypothetical protein
LIADHPGMHETPFYSKIVYNDSVGEDDETYYPFKKALREPIVQAPHNNLMQFLNEHLRVKKNHDAIYKFFMSDFKVPNDTMKK